MNPIVHAFYVEIIVYALGKQQQISANHTHGINQNFVFSQFPTRFENDLKFNIHTRLV